MALSLPTNQFLLLFLFLFICFLTESEQLLLHHSPHFIQKRSTTDCPEEPKDVQKGEEGEVCYGRLNGSAFSFLGKKIAGEPDSKIYKAYNFLQGIQSEERKSTKAFAVKVVSTGTRARAVNLAKPLVMIKHELHMLKLFNKLEANKPVAEQSVVKLFSGGVVVDKSPMIVAHKRLPFHLNLKQYMPLVNEQIKRNAEHLLLSLANTLMNFHKYAVHLHLKPGNWVFVRGEDKWKLIDLQSAIPNFEQSNAKSLQAEEERFPEDFVEFACNSLSNEIFLTKFIARANEWPSTYASPEHISACKRAHSPGINRRPDQTKMQVAQLMQIGPKSDVWSFGILMLEMLAHTPQVNPPELKMDPLDIFVKIRAEFVNESLAKDRKGMRQHFKEFVHFNGRRERTPQMDGQDLDIKLENFCERPQKESRTEASCGHF